MKKILSFAIASVMLLSAVSCTKTAEPVAVSSTASAAETFLSDRIGTVPDGVILGDAGVAASYGVDMTDFEDDGYILRTVGDKTLVFGKTEEGLDRAVRKYAKAYAAGTAAELDEVYHEGYRIERLTIAGRDISEYTVYYPETANENMKFAADELVRLVKKATGTELPVVVGDPISPAIELRHSDDAELKSDGYRYMVTDDGLIIEGAVKRGCMYGVWRFLEWEFGWDRLIYGNSYLSESDHVEIPVGTERCEVPVFEYLGFYEGRYVLNNECTTPNAAQSSYPMTHPGGHGMAHNKFCSIDFSFDQICYTDEERYDECYENVRNYVAARYGSVDFGMVDIGQGDNDNYCFCENCFEVFLEDRSTIGAVIRFVNGISEEINAEFPGISFAILAYTSAKTPPKVTRPNEYININFCYDMNCANHPVDGSKCTTKMNVNGLNNKHYDEIVRGWSEITDNLYVRNYGINQHLLDNTMVDTIYDDMRYFRDLGIKGLLYEVQSFGLGTKHLEKHLIHEMNWNPDMTREEYDEVFRKVLEHEYGDGWVYIEEYMNEWMLAQSLADCFHCWGWNTLYFWSDDKVNTHFYKDRFDYFVELFDKAIYAADSAKQEMKAELLSCSMIYMGCYSSYFHAYIAGDTDRIAVLEERYSRIHGILTENGFNPKKLPTLTNSGSDLVALPDTVEEAAWSSWYHKYSNLTGYPLPDDAPVIEK